MDLEQVIAQLHEELGLIDRAIADLERLPVNGLRVSGRPRSVRHPGRQKHSAQERRERRAPDVESKSE